MKAHYTLIKHKCESNEFDTYEITLNSEAVMLQELLADMEIFLKSCGYVFSGHLILADDIEADKEDV